MTVEQDIIDQRIEAVTTLDNKIEEARRIKDGLPLADHRQAQLSQTIFQLKICSVQLHVQTLIDDLHGAQLQAALAAITNATDDLKREAARMRDATSFISNLNSVLGAATKVMNVLKIGG